MRVETYTTSSGSDPVMGYIRSQPPQEQKRLLKLLDKISDQPQSNMRAILNKIIDSNPSIFETSVGRQRILGGFHGDDIFWVLHAFPKKEQRTRDSDIRIAQDRLKDVKIRF